MSISISDFAGHWLISRHIRHADGQDGRFEGSAVLTPDQSGLVYREEGTLSLGSGQSMRAERTYLWRPDGECAISILFDDGRAFHRIDLDGAEPEDRHYCDPDIYDVHYDFRAWPNWSSRWRVTGPRKDYVMQSDYRPTG